MRPSNRAPNQMRTVTLEPGFAKYAEGSCLVKFGDTHVLCTASVDDKVPGFLRNSGLGWVTAEYGMLPRATHERSDREAAKGRQSGRSQEIQRLIGRSLRAVVDRKLLGELQIKIDCDVLQADGGTRTAAITGAYVALGLAFHFLLRTERITANPLTDSVAAISCGLFNGVPVLDLDYGEDSNAQADANFVMTGKGGIVEIQGTAEQSPFSEEQFQELLKLARKGVAELTALQKTDLEHVMRPFDGHRLVIATHNTGKLREFTELLSGCAKSIVSSSDLHLPEPEETGKTFAENAILKAKDAAKRADSVALADDSGLCVTALKGAPGIYSARWGGPTKDFPMAMKRVYDELGDAEDRSAYFICVLALAWPDGHVETLEGRVDGHIVWPPRGDKGHGYDPVFVPDGHARTFAEMDGGEKHALSHRGIAVHKLIQRLRGI